MIYEVIAYTGPWAHRRLFFKDEESAREYAAKEFENDDVLEVWLCTIDTERTGAYGALELISNMPILSKC